MYSLPRLAWHILYFCVICASKKLGGTGGHGKKAKEGCGTLCVRDAPRGLEGWKVGMLELSVKKKKNMQNLGRQYLVYGRDGSPV